MDTRDDVIPRSRESEQRRLNLRRTLALTWVWCQCWAIPPGSEKGRKTDIDVSKVWGASSNGTPIFRVNHLPFLVFVHGKRLANH